MKRTIKVMFLLVMIVVTCISTAFASVEKWGTIVSEVNVRTGPSTDYQIVGRLFPGREIQIISCYNEWYEVDFNGRKAYVYGEYVGHERMETDAQLIGTYTTYYDPYNSNRDYNIRKASDTFDGLMVMPGTTISFNDLNGEACCANGYKEAPVQVDGKTVPGEGGGVCQVSTTLFNALDDAGIEIVERYSHKTPVSYVPTGRDATIAYGYLDFVFRNNYEYPITIATLAGYDKLIVNVYKESK